MSSGLITIFLGFLLLIDVDIYLGKGGIIISTFLNTSICLLFGLFLIIISKFIKKEIYSKCPECKETYDYSKLKKGICTKCNIKTIGMEKYYDNNTKI